jgi:Tfp pilus assembly protein PilF
MGESDVARWHRLSGLPDNVTDEGEVISAEAGRRASEEKAQMRAAIARIRDTHPSEEARNSAKLAASYLLAGDVETARRYLDKADSL